MEPRHPDEGAIHAYVEGQLPLGEAARVEQHVLACEDCAAAVAEARGIIAAASRIVGALDEVPAGVIPARRGWRMPRWIAAAAVLLLAVGVGSVAVRDRGGMEATRGVVPDAALAADRREMPPAAKPAAGPAAEATRQQIRPAPPPIAPAPQPTAPVRDEAPRAVEPGSRPIVAAARENEPLPRDERETSPRLPQRDSLAEVVVTGGFSTDASGRAAAMSRPREADLSGRGVTASTAPAAGTSTAAAAPSAPPTPQALRANTLPAPLRVVRYEAAPGVTIEMREYDAGPLPALPPIAARGANEYRWSDEGGTRLYVLSGQLSIAELERLAGQLGELKVIP